MEQWRDIKGCEGYSINKDGRVYSALSGKYLLSHIAKIGYRIVGLQVNGKSVKHYIHRLLGEHFIPNPHNKPQINHKDGIKTNNALDNLEWVTSGENIRHAFRTGLMSGHGENKGEVHGMSRLTEQSVIEIRKRILSGESTASICKEYNVCESTINRAAKGITWSHLPKFIV